MDNPILIALSVLENPSEYKGLKQDGYQISATLNIQIALFILTFFYQITMVVYNLFAFVLLNMVKISHFVMRITLYSCYIHFLQYETVYSLI